MEFFIRKNATLPILEINLIKDGRSDYNYKNTDLSSSTLKVSMIDEYTGNYKIIDGNCVYEPKDDSIYYQFNKRSTNKVGRYFVDFSVTTGQGTIILPLNDKIYVTVLDSFVDNEFCCGTGNPPLPGPPQPTPTPTPIIPTSTPIPTQTPVPTATPFVNNFAYLFIEPISGSSNIGQWMFDNASTGFYGFTNQTQPSQVQLTFNDELNSYLSFSGWSGGVFPSVITQIVPQADAGLDSYGNSIVKYNFITTEIQINTVQCDAWYTWVIPTGATFSSGSQGIIDYNDNNDPNDLVSVNMESTIYSRSVYYTGTTIPVDTYRVYTTYPSNNFYLNNASSIYFKGNTIT